MEKQSLSLQNQIITSSLQRSTYINKTVKEWSEILAKECMVYRLNDQYVAKSFESIAYRLCTEDTASDILLRNIDILLYYKYFPKPNDDEIDRIEKIKAFCVKRIASMVQQVKFEDGDSAGTLMKPLPPSCIAFNNGVYDFAASDWLFKYDVIPIDDTRSLIQYPYQYRIMWYVNRNFTPSLFSSVPLSTLTFREFVAFMKDRNDTVSPSKFFQLFYNMSYDETYTFSFKKALHLAEIFGFLLYSPFCQHFVFMLGEGSNGKDSMFDAFFRECILPIPSSNSVSDLEEDRFVIGNLIGVGQNICSETESRVIKKSAILKQLTGSQFQTIEEKGVSKYTGYMNCKFIFAANNVDQLKFNDASIGYRRRVNMYKCYFQWDRNKHFLNTYPNCYDTTYNSSAELRAGDGLEEFFLTAMYGIDAATDHFTKPFHFTVNDYNYEEFTNVDDLLDEYLGDIRMPRILTKIKSMFPDKKIDDIFYNDESHPVKLSKETKRTSKEEIGFMENAGNKPFIQVLIDALTYNSKADVNEGESPLNFYFVDHGFFLSIDFLFDLVNPGSTKTTFTQGLKRNYPGVSIRYLGANKSYILSYFDMNGKLKFGVKR